MSRTQNGDVTFTTAATPGEDAPHKTNMKKKLGLAKMLRAIGWAIKGKPAKLTKLTGNPFKMFEERTNKYKATVPLSVLLQQAAAGEPPMLDLSKHHQFLVLTPEQKNETLLQLAAAQGASLGAIVLHGLELDDSNADALAAILTSNPTLGLLSLERNRLRDEALLAIAKAAQGHEGLRELRVGEQTPFKVSSAAAEGLIEVIETTPTLLKLGLGRVREGKLLDRLEAAEMANLELVRQKRVESGGGEDAVPAWVPLWEEKLNPAKFSLIRGDPKKKGALSDALMGKAGIVERNVKKRMAQAKPVDWVEEARLIASSEPPQYGTAKQEGGLRKPPADAEGASYVLTGDLTWPRAKVDERAGVVAAFGTNTTIRAAGLAGASVDERLGVLWGQVLQRNRTLTSLNLESNALGSESLQAIATALAGTPALTELRLANQRKTFSQADEAMLAEAVEANHRIVKLAVDLRNTNAKDRVSKALSRNQNEARQAKKAGTEVPCGAPTAEGPVLP